MEISGTKKSYEKVDIETSASDVLQALRTLWFKSTITDIPYQSHDQVYINSNGKWEGWSNGHGSGYTDIYREATPDEIEFLNAFTIVNRALYNK